MRTIPHSHNQIYLTFDDGPEDPGTSSVLEILARHGAHATFFLIAEKAQKNPALFKRILQDGHTVGNHSLDHRYAQFFSRSVEGMEKWIRSADEMLELLSGSKPVGFRSPNGIRTPPLTAALERMREPLILWNVRFFDAILPWTEQKARRALKTLRAGDIVLLHDCQRARNLKTFLTTLEIFLSEGKARGFVFETLNRTLIQRAAPQHEQAKDATGLNV